VAGLRFSGRPERLAEDLEGAELGESIEVGGLSDPRALGEGIRASGRIDQHDDQIGAVRGARPGQETIEDLEVQKVTAARDASPMTQGRHEADRSVGRRV